MSDTPTPRTDSLMEEWHHCPPTKQLLNHSRQLERELAEARRELVNQESECGRFSVIVRDLNAQLTAHKAALEKCEKALSATWADLDHLNHWMPTPCRELYMDAKLEIARLKGNQ